MPLNVRRARGGHKGGGLECRQAAIASMPARHATPRRTRRADCGYSLASVAVQKSASLSRAKSDMRTSEPKPHQINKLLVSFDSEVRKRACSKMMRTSESGH